MSHTKQPKMLTPSRRDLLKMLGAGVALSVMAGCGKPAKDGAAGRVVVVGGGFGGATAAKYIKRGNPDIQVTLVEPNSTFYTCPFSNLYLAGERSYQSLAHNYDELKHRYGVTVLATRAEDIDPVTRKVRLASGDVLDYDKLVLSPGISIRWDALEGYDRAAAELAPHAWLPGEQPQLLRRQLQAMDDGGTVIISAPDNPFRCPPGPYERASLICHYLRTHKPRSKVLILDAKDSFSKQGLFMEGWRALYGDQLEWVGMSGDGRVVRVDAEHREVFSEFGTAHRADVLNVIPPQQAGQIAHRTGLTDASGWVPVNPRDFSALQADDIYVVGDACVAAPMPKSGFAANAQAKVAAAAIVAALDGRAAPEPYWANTCYSLLDPDYGITVAAIYRLNGDGQIAAVAESDGVSPLGAEPHIRKLEARYAHTWYNAIAQDTWGSEG